MFRKVKRRINNNLFNNILKPIYIKNNIRKLRKKIKNKEKIKVAFLVSERQKWNCEQLYQKFTDSGIYEPIILIIDPNDVLEKDLDKELTKNYNFFKELNLNVDYAYKNNEYLDLKKFNIDMLFYQQPWDVNKKHSVEIVSKFALTFYIPYAVVNTTFISKQNYPKNFYEKIFSYFIINEEGKELFRKEVSDKINYVVVGHPKLDTYLDKIEYEKKYIIYAPHHSISSGSALFSSFFWNGKEILEFAKNHKELNWVFKPHPAWKKSIINSGFFSVEEAEEYCKQWAEIGIVYDSGNYFDLFKQSKCLITDCSSFLVEYFPTKNPVILLVSNNSVKRDEVIARDLVNSYYNIHNLTELNDCLKNVILEEKDEMKEKRLYYFNKFKDVFNADASLNIINYLNGIVYDK